MESLESVLKACKASLKKEYRSLPRNRTTTVTAPPDPRVKDYVKQPHTEKTLRFLVGKKTLRSLPRQAP